jgi:hypothetical protein
MCQQIPLVLLRGHSIIDLTGLIFQPEECRAFVVPNVYAKKGIFKDSEITWQEIEVHLPHINDGKIPSFTISFPLGSVVHKLQSINRGANHAGISINPHRPEAGTQPAARGLFFFRRWLAARLMKEETRENNSFAAAEKKEVRIQEMLPMRLSVNS